MSLFSIAQQCRGEHARAEALVYAGLDDHAWLECARDGVPAHSASKPRASISPECQVAGRRSFGDVAGQFGIVRDLRDVPPDDIEVESEHVGEHRRQVPRVQRVEIVREVGVFR